MLRKTPFNPRQAYLLQNYCFPATSATSASSNGSIVWLAPCSKSFKQNALSSAAKNQGSKFVFVEGNKVDPSIFTTDPTRKESVVVVSAQPVTRDFLQAWRSKFPRNNNNKEEQQVDSFPSDLTLIRRGTSMASIDLEAAKDHAIRVINTPGTNSPHVAKYCLEKLQLDEKQEDGVPRKVVVIGAGSVGRCLVQLLNAAGIAPFVKTSYPEELSSFKVSGTCTSFEEAFDSATHIAVCTDSSKIEAKDVEKLASSLPGKQKRIVCIARPLAAFSLDAILKMIESSSNNNNNNNIKCTFDYGEAVLAPVQKQLKEALGGESQYAEKTQKCLEWTTKAMHSDSCNCDMDEAVLRVLNPKLPQTLNLTTSSNEKVTSSSNNNNRDILGVIGGPSAWFQAFLHLTSPSSNNNTNTNNSTVNYYRPSFSSSAIWHTSGRQISLREKVTKFTPLTSGAQNLRLDSLSELTENDNFLLKSLVTMGTTTIAEKMSSSASVMKMRSDIEHSVRNWRKLNEFLESVGEQKVWNETGRLVIGNPATDSSFESIKKWRSEKDLVINEDDGASSSSSSSSSSLLCSSQKYLDTFCPLLFNSGYSGYKLQMGGWVEKDVEEIVFRALSKKFGADRFRIIETNVQSVVSLSSASSEEQQQQQQKYRVCTADANEAIVDSIYLSPGATHVVMSLDGTTSATRLNPPIQVTGFSGIVRQKISTERRAEILRKGNCKTLREFFSTHPACFMDNSFELTFESVAEEESVIRWRVTGGATINSGECSHDPIKLLFNPVKRFLSDGGDEKDGVTLENGKFASCTRQVGPAFAEQIVPFGEKGFVALNWGHYGITLAGSEIRQKL